jgi:hypothetical protein
LRFLFDSMSTYVRVVWCRTVSMALVLNPTRCEEACFLACALDTLHTGEAPKISGRRWLHALESEARRPNWESLECHA